MDELFSAAHERGILIGGSLTEGGKRIFSEVMICLKFEVAVFWKLSLLALLIGWLESRGWQGLQTFTETWLENTLVALKGEMFSQLVASRGGRNRLGLIYGAIVIIKLGDLRVGTAGKALVGGSRGTVLALCV